MNTGYMNSLDQKTLDLLDRVFGHLPVSMVLTDAEGRIILLNDHYADFLRVDKLQVIGRFVDAVVPNTRIPVVLKTGNAEISSQHVYGNGIRSIVHRIPFFTESGAIAGCLGIVLFESMEELQRLAKANEVLHIKLSAYQNEIKNIFQAKYTFTNIIEESSLMHG